MEILESDREPCPRCQAPTVWASNSLWPNRFAVNVEPEPTGYMRLDYHNGVLVAQVVPRFERDQTVATYGMLYRKHPELCESL